MSYRQPQVLTGKDDEPRSWHSQLGGPGRHSVVGGFAASVDGEAVADGAWRLRKARELVKLLALARGGRLHREQLMDVLWRDRDPASAANNLNQAVHAARRALRPEAIESRDELLVADVDVIELERAAVTARRLRTARAYRVALDLCRGELLPENRYDEWVAERRDELDDLHCSLLGELERLGDSGDRLSLPSETSSFVGRERDLASLEELLGRTRLLTLTGTGGVGKTRLALALARNVEAAFEDGAVLVELSEVADAAGVADVFSTALDVRALPGWPTLEAVGDFLAARNALLVVDEAHMNTGIHRRSRVQTLPLGATEPSSARANQTSRLSYPSPFEHAESRR